MWNQYFHFVFIDCAVCSGSDIQFIDELVISFHKKDMVFSYETTLKWTMLQPSIHKISIVHTIKIKQQNICISKNFHGWKIELLTQESMDYC